MIGSKEAAIIKFDKFVHKLCNYQHLNSVGADIAETQLDGFNNSVIVLQKEKFSDIDFKFTQTDAFIGTFLNANP